MMLINEIIFVLCLTTSIGIYRFLRIAYYMISRGWAKINVSCKTVSKQENAKYRNITYTRMIAVNFRF